MLFIFHFFKKYGVIVQNGAHTLKINIWPIDIMTMASMPVELDSYHDSNLETLRMVSTDREREKIKSSQNSVKTA